MYLRASDLAGRKNWKPTMGDFRLDDEGNWWYHAIDKSNKSAKIAVRDIYVEWYLKRYRRANHAGKRALRDARRRHGVLTCAVASGDRTAPGAAAHCDDARRRIIVGDWTITRAISRLAPCSAVGGNEARPLSGHRTRMLWREAGRTKTLYWINL